MRARHASLPGQWPAHPRRQVFGTPVLSVLNQESGNEFSDRSENSSLGPRKTQDARIPEVCK